MAAMNGTFNNTISRPNLQGNETTGEALVMITLGFQNLAWPNDAEIRILRIYAPIYCTSITDYDAYGIRRYYFVSGED